MVDGRGQVRRDMFAKLQVTESHSIIMGGELSVPEDQIP
jgi:hypothetical protein